MSAADGTDSAKPERETHYFFAGGGTGGHIYPALSIAEQLRKINPDASITFFCSDRRIDSQILAGSGFEYVSLVGGGFSIRPDKLVSFFAAVIRNFRTAQQCIAEAASSGRVVVVGVGGFVSVPVILAAYKNKAGVGILNVDAVPGKANRLLASLAQEVFVQFEDTAAKFSRCRAQVTIAGCPLREGFRHPQRDKVISELGLCSEKKTLVVTGASSGAANINSAMCRLLGRLGRFAEQWQIVHLAGRGYQDGVENAYRDAAIGYKVLDYYDDMGSLYAAADLVVGRAGGVSVAEYAAAGIASICVPYPFHRDKHQYRNAFELAKAGGAVVVNDAGSDFEKTAENIFVRLKGLVKNDEKRERMGRSAKELAILDAGKTIAEKLMVMKTARGGKSGVGIK